MTDFFDRAILIGMGLEKKARELLDELQKAGRKEEEEKPHGEGEPLTAKQVVENRVVDEGVRVLKEFISVVKSGRERLEKECTTGSEKLLDKLHIPSQEDMDVVKEMVRVAREKVDILEKRIEELEKRLARG